MDTVACEIETAARSKELAVEVFLKFWRDPKLPIEYNKGWPYHTAVRKGLDELRSRNRRLHSERLFGFMRSVPNPDSSPALKSHSEGGTSDYMDTGKQMNVVDSLAQLTLKRIGSQM